MREKSRRRAVRKKSSILIITGLLLIAAALSLTIFNLYDEYRAEQSVNQILSRMAPQEDTLLEGEIPDYLLNPAMEMPVEIIDGRDYIGTLQIPSLDLKLPVLSSWNYPNLRVAPCRYTGSAYQGNLIIAAHNYPSHFGNLKHLQEGETVLFTDADGNRFTYQVVVRETLEPTAIDEMESEEDGAWDLTLFTCTIGGQSRVTVRCVQVENS
ncbi:MAG: sortase [Firmicutes bacterium]|nr:sortase [Bacillota bacterium]MDD7601068.1 sortase [Bacillota bacterium]MDY5856502.1 sortase [Anaerovoracaceae bacterium]